jgi:hypothetical protein
MLLSLTGDHRFPFSQAVLLLLKKRGESRAHIELGRTGVS